MTASPPAWRHQSWPGVCTWLLGVFVAISLVVGAGASCRAVAQHDKSTQEPAPQTDPLVLDTLYVEQRQSGQVGWTLRAKDARGALSALWVTELRLQVNASDSETTIPFSFRAPRAELNLEQGHATLHDVEGTDGKGLTLCTPKALWRKDDKCITSEGPVRVDGPQLSLEAQQASAVWPSGDLFLLNVQGRFKPRQQQDPK